MPNITGHTELVGLMAYPIRHTQSPTTHNLAYDKNGDDVIQLAFEVDSDSLEAAVNSIRALKMLGSNISMPNKTVVHKYLEEVDGTAAMKQLKAEGALKFDVDGATVSLAEEDLLIDVAQKAGFVTEADNYVTVVLDTNLSPELIEEGFVYEVISKIQTMRKEADFEVMDHIRVAVNGNAKLAEIVTANKNAIAEKVLADEILVDAELAITKEWNVNGEKVSIGVEKW